MRYTVWYEGYLFVGDSDGLNEHHFDKWDDIKGLICAYGDIIHVDDNEYGVSYFDGEWW